MGSLILCYKKKAERAYEITRIHRKIYTMEELCYYLCNHLYLIDDTIMNDRICDWLDEELDLPELAHNLRQSIKHHASVEQFVIMILSSSSIYTTQELYQIRNVLEKLKCQKEIERKKFKADNLLESGAIRSAILVYQSIISEEHDDSVDGKFYGKIYGCLGAAYGRLFLYKEAARMYNAGYQICEEESMLKAYVYCCSQYMTGKKYEEFLAKSELFQEMDVRLAEEVKELKEVSMPTLNEDTLKRWKENYRTM